MGCYRGSVPGRGYNPAVIQNKKKSYRLIKLVALLNCKKVKFTTTFTTSVKNKPLKIVFYVVKKLDFYCIYGIG